MWPHNDGLIRAKMLLDLITDLEKKIYLNGFSPYGPEKRMQEECLRKWKEDYYKEIDAYFPNLRMFK